MEKLSLALQVSVLSIALTACGSSDSKSKSDKDDNDQNQTTSLIDISQKPAVMISFKTVFNECVERSWAPLADEYRNLQVMIIDKIDGEVVGFLWNYDGGTDNFSVIPEGSITEGFLNSPAGEFEGRETVSIDIRHFSEEYRVEDSRGTSGVSQYIFNNILGVIQFINWEKNSAPDSVYPDSIHLDGPKLEYPLPSMTWEPLYLRSEIAESLESTLLEDTDLGAAAYWLEKYENTYPQESDKFKRSVESLGVDNYIIETMQGLAQLGCEATEDDLMTFSADRIDYNTSWVEAGIDPKYTFNPAVTDVGAIGFLSSMLLNRMGDPDWQQRVHDGEDPVHILLENEVPQMARDDPEKQLIFQEAQAELDQALSQSIANLYDSNYYRLAINSDHLLGGRGNGTYLLMNDSSFSELTANMSAYYEFSNSSVEININDNLEGTDLFLTTKALCATEDQKYDVFYIPKNAVIAGSSDGLFTSTDPNITFEDIPAQIIDEGGHEWVCIP